MKKMSHLFVVCLLLASMIGFTGCSSTRREAVSSANQERYFSLTGIYSAVFASSLMQMDRAVRTTCYKASLLEEERTNSLNSCHYVYRDINGIRVDISLYEQKEGMVKINIRVGSGDKESSQLLLIEIDSQLRSQGAVL